MEETIAILECLIDMGLILSVSFKDGVQAHDFADILKKIEDSPELKAKLMFAYNNIDKVKSEMSAMTWADGIKLVAHVAPKLIETVKAIQA